MRPNIDDSTTFSAGEIENLPAFITKLTSKNGITKYLNSKLTKATRQQLEKFDGSGQQKHTMAISLAELLNSIIKGPSIYDVKRFEGVVFRPETSRMLDESPQGEALVRLNRLLLEDAYPQELSKNYNDFDPTEWHPIDRRLFLHLIDGRDTKVFRGVFADWLVRRCAIKSVRKKINNMIEREPKASRKKKREINEDQNKKIMEALNNAKNKVISQLKKLPLDEQIDFLNEKPIGWLTKRKENKYNSNEYIYPDNVQADYYYDLQAGGNLPHIELRREATNSRLAKSIIFKYIEQNKDLHTLEQSWTKTNSTMWVPPSFMLSLIIEEVYTKQRDINTLPVKLAKLIKSHWRKPKEVGHMLRLKSYFAYCWPQLKRRYILGESAQKLDTETARFVYPDSSNDVMPGQVQTVARTRASFSLHYKQKVHKNR